VIGNGEEDSMESGRFEKLPKSELAAFREDLAREAKLKGLGLTVTVMDRGDGTVDVEWRVGPTSVAPSVNPDIPAKPPVPALNVPGAVPAGGPGRFVSARRTGVKIVTYVDEDAREVVREGGSRSWRNNNPGNIRKGDFVITAGAIGDDGSFGIFADLKSGLAAITALLQTASYRDLTLEGAIFRYAPPSENDTGAYVDFVESKSGVSRGEVMRQLAPERLAAVAEAIRKMEGWVEGIERADQPASLLAASPGVAPSGITSAAAASGEWMQIAEEQAGLPERERSEWPDPGENPRILNYFRVAAPWFEPGDGDETDWCAAFVNFCLLGSGHIGTNHPGARSFFWNKKGQFVPIAAPVRGCIAVQRHAPFDDPKWETGAGHVGFVTSSTATHVTLLGGNQSKTVKVQSFPLVTTNASGKVVSRFVSFMMPVMN
jgi:uncharacterized protein (TIGR02594 family)